MKIATIIQYSSQDNDLIEFCVNEAKEFSSEVVVMSLDRFFTGEVDNKRTYKDFINVEWENKSGWYLHRKVRLEGLRHIKNNYDGVMLLDGDEIAEGKRVKEYLKSWKGYNVMFASYWYYRDTCYQALQYENSAHLVNKQSITELLKNPYKRIDQDRRGMVSSWNGIEMLNNEPLFHHYSWARKKEGLLEKVRTWGHNKDADWISIIGDSLDRPFNYTCPFKNYDFIKVNPYVGITFNE